jgi:predicted metal-dependent phosphoesterase TrpH
MIDLHIHSTFSDGSDTLAEIVKKANVLNLEAISITDHNKCKAFLKENNGALKNFNGKTVTGCEFFTNYSGFPIEILAYGFDAEIVHKFIKKHYPSFLQDRLKRLILTMGVLDKIKIKYDKELLVGQVKDGGSMSGSVLKNITSYDINGFLLEDFSISRSCFLRKYLANPDNPFFVDYSSIYPSLHEIINVVKDAGGICVLAHPYEYCFDVNKCLPDMINTYNLSGVECYYPTFSDSQIDYLVSYCRENNLIITGGSDYHGEHRVNKLGLGIDNNLHIKREYLQNFKL